MEENTHDKTAAVEGGIIVLVAVDKSKESEMALDFYLESMHRPSTEVVLLNCLDPSLPANYLAFEPNLNIAGYEVWLGDQMQERREMDDLMEKISLKLDKLKVKHRSIVQDAANAGESIVKVASEQKARFVVMGTRGQGTIRRTIFGSVSDYVLHHAAVPVFVYRNHTKG